MDAAELQRKIDHAFRNVVRPTTFTPCHCEECLALDTLLQTRDHSTFAADDVDVSLCLLSPDASLNPEQISVLVNFLTYIEEKWYAEIAEETPRELARAIRNWRRLAVDQ